MQRYGTERTKPSNDVQQIMYDLLMKFNAAQGAVAEAEANFCTSHVHTLHRIIDRSGWWRKAAAESSFGHFSCSLVAGDASRSVGLIRVVNIKIAVRGNLGEKYTTRAGESSRG